MTEQPRKYLYLTSFVLSLVVIVLGAYTRLTDAGLGCPDWPGCYQRLFVPSAAEALAAFPDAPLDPMKAWAEMIHRYAAGTLALILFALMVDRLRTHGLALCHSFQGRVLSLSALLIVFQAALGMWTVTMKLLPLVVMAHLLGGFTIVSLLWLLTLDAFWGPAQARTPVPKLLWVLLGLLIFQITLGAWTSTNYAALSCPSFPACSPEVLIPSWDWQAFDITRGIGWINPLEAMSHQDRMVIQMAHRFGALLTVLVFFFFQVIALRRGYYVFVGVTTLLLVSQIILGISNVLLWLPLPIAMMHHTVAAMLLLTLLTHWRYLRIKE